MQPAEPRALAMQLDRAGKHERAESSGMGTRRTRFRRRTQPRTGFRRASPATNSHLRNSMPPTSWNPSTTAPKSRRQIRRARPTRTRGPTRLRSPSISSAARMCRPISGSTTTTATTTPPTRTTNTVLRAGHGWSASPPSSPRSRWWFRCRCSSRAPTPASWPTPATTTPPVDAADAGRDHHHQATAAASAATAHHGDPDSHGDPDRDGDAASAAAAAPAGDEHRGTATGAHDVGGGGPAATDHDPRPVRGRSPTR